MNITLPKTYPVTCHTDFVQQDSIFVAIKGYSDNGIHYIKQAIEKGATQIVIENGTILDNELSSFIVQHKVTITYVENTRKSLADLSAHYADFPAKKLKIIGITGTKGKTTTAFLTEHILKTAGYKTALISSAQNKILHTAFPASLTTPQPDYLQQFLKTCVEHSVEYVVMEIAAQALTLHRVNDIILSGIIFTNFSHEHLEFYTTLDDYFAAKCSIFTMKNKNIPILINNDDTHCSNLLSKNSSFISYGINNTAIYKAVYDHNSLDKINLHITHKNISHAISFTCPTLFGFYNAYNVLAAIALTSELCIETSIIQQSLLSFPGVPGRLQRYILPNGAYAFIDYAHNPASFHAILSTLQKLTDHLIVVFGAGGGRDKAKRPVMGTIAAQYADTIIITSDNPRLENALEIALEIIQGIATENQHKIVKKLDREDAIKYAYTISRKNSIIALLGKGPDEYQIIGTTKTYFSERKILQQLSQQK